MSCSNLKYLYFSSLNRRRDSERKLVICMVSHSAAGFMFLTNLRANRCSVKCSSAGTLTLRNSAANAPCRFSELYSDCYKEKKQALTYLPQTCSVSDGCVRYTALSHLLWAPFERDVKQLKAQGGYGLMQRLHEALRFGCWKNCGKCDLSSWLHTLLCAFKDDCQGYYTALHMAVKKTRTQD